MTLSPQAYGIQLGAPHWPEELTSMLTVSEPWLRLPAGKLWRSEGNLLDNRPASGISP